MTQVGLCAECLGLLVQAPLPEMHRIKSEFLFEQCVVERVTL